MRPLVVLVLYLRAIECRLEPPNDEVEVKVVLANCVTKAAETFFREKEVITVLNPDVSTVYDHRSLLFELFSRTKWTMLMKKARKKVDVMSPRNPLELKLSNTYIMQVLSEQDIEINLNFSKLQPSWNPHAKFIIVSTLFAKNSTDILMAIIKKTWSYNVLRGVIIQPSTYNSSLYKVYTWFPYTRHSCGKSNRVKEVGSCSIDTFNVLREWFEDKIPNNLYRCPIRVRTIVYPPFTMEPAVKVKNTLDQYEFTNGLEIKLMNMVGVIANLSVKYYMSETQENWGDINVRKNSTSGIIGLLFENKYDIGLGSMAINPESHVRLDSTSPYYQDSVRFCVPHAKERPQFRRLTDIISPIVFIALTLTGTIFIFIIWFLARHSKKERKSYKNYIALSLRMAQISTSNASNLFPKTSQVRTFLAAWILFCLFFTFIYQTFLMSCLTTPNYEAQIKTTQDILNTDLEILFLDAYKQYFYGEGWTNPQVLAVMRRWKTCDNLDNCLDRTAFEKDSVVTASRMYTSYAKGRYVSVRGNPLLYCFKDNIVTFPVVMYMRKGFPLHQRIDEIVNYIVEAGFMQMWEDNAFLYYKMVQFEEEKKLDTIMRFSHLEPIFVVLAVGNSLSSVAFFLELGVHYYKTRQ